MIKQYLRHREVYLGGMIGGIIPLIGFLLSKFVPTLFYLIFIPYYPLSFLGLLMSLITENENLIFWLSFVLLTAEYIVIGMIIGSLLIKKKLSKPNN